MDKAIVELELLYSDTKKDHLLKERLLATRLAADPMDAFCKIACEFGYPITVGELFTIGQENSDKQCKSTNGGNPNPFDSFEDMYEIFLGSL